MTTTVVKERQGSHHLILHSITLKKPTAADPPNSFFPLARRYNVSALPPNNSNNTNPHEIRCQSCGALADFNTNPAPQPNTLAGYLDQLSDSEKHRAWMREAALEGLVRELTRFPEDRFLDSNRVTLVDQCLRVVKRGRSAEELVAAARAIGLVAMIVGDDVEAAHEIYRDSVTKLFEAVKLGRCRFELPAQVVECLAVVTFFGGYLSEHRLESMAMIWDYFFRDSADAAEQGKKKKEQSPELVAAAISSWCFMLSSNKYGISRTHWQKAIPCFFRLLGHDNEFVVLAAAEALAFIVEIDSFMSVPKPAAVEDNGAQGESSSSSSSSSSHPSIHNIAQKLNERLLLMKAIDHEEGKEQENTRATRLAFVAKFFEEVSSCKRLDVTEEKGMILTTWTERLQFAFLEGFLGKETFAEHIKVNKQLQRMFTLKMAAKKVDEKPRIVAYDVEREEVKSRLYKPELKWMTNEDGSLYNEGSKQRLILKKLTKSPTSWWSKARTQHMKKQRQVAATDRGKNIIGPDYD